MADEDVETFAFQAEINQLMSLIIVRPPTAVLFRAPAPLLVRGALRVVFGLGGGGDGDGRRSTWRPHRRPRPLSCATRPPHPRRVPHLALRSIFASQQDIPSSNTR